MQFQREKINFQSCRNSSQVLAPGAFLTKQVNHKIKLDIHAPLIRRSLCFVSRQVETTNLNFKAIIFRSNNASFALANLCCLKGNKLIAVPSVGRNCPVTAVKNAAGGQSYVKWLQISHLYFNIIQYFQQGLQNYLHQKKSESHACGDLQPYLPENCFLFRTHFWLIISLKTN